MPLGVLVLGGILLFALGGGRYLSFAALADNREWLLAHVADAGIAAPVVFVLIYAGLVALSFPAAEVLTIAGGFLFGRWLGTLCAVAGATTGATIVFLAARAGLAGLAARAGPWAARFQDGFRRDAFHYLLVLRLIPLFPFSLVNLVAGAAGLPLRVYVAGTLIGIIPGTFIYTSLGTGLGDLIIARRRPGFSVLLQAEVYAPLLGLALLALLPIAYRCWRRRRGRPPV